ncbi:uroporphyrin-III C-methyltransferase [Dehalogenimonas lykanthroporepellens BL-DC-9]|nr:uroporphyrin-III C-methyltransferase [Dehalogenimonas lykanthroporepellens BL-DC-9]
MRQGKVYLVGAGPGDPGLITVKGLECLSKAEVIVYDHLLDESLMEAAGTQAERIYAGKKAGCHALKQEEINRLLVEKAAQGKTVVRLKGGDPFVFGRGGEEAEELRAAGLPFEVVPGITSSIAAPAYAGIPVTHRTLASSFSVVTGHEDPTKETSSIDWANLATATDTLVFLMGTANLPNIVARLVQYGRPAETPAAVIMNGTRPEQKVVTGTLANIVERSREADIKPPSITVVGDVVRMRDVINWFDNRPLHGRKVLVTRSRRQASDMSRELKARGALPVELPVISIETGDERALDEAIRRGAFDWVIFTSVNGVEAFFNRLQAAGKDARWFAGGRIAAIGPATGAALENRGLRPDSMPEQFTAAAVLAALSDQQIEGMDILLPRADIAPPLLAEGLRNMGGKITEIAAYRTRGEAGVSAEAAGRAAAECRVITFCSSSTVEHFLKKVSVDVLPADTITACIGPVTAATAEKLGLKVDIVAAEHTIPGLVTALEDYFRTGRGA